VRSGRNRKLDAALLAVWMVVWTSAIVVALWTLGAEVLAGEIGAGVFLAVWLCAAGYGLWSAGRRIVELLVTGRPRRPDSRRWDDGIDPPEG
jgi:hypothetical protein